MSDQLIIDSLLDTDVYKLFMQWAYIQCYPEAIGEYEFIDRTQTVYPKGFVERLQDQIRGMKSISLSSSEYEHILSYPLFPQCYADFLRGYRFNPDEVDVSVKDGKLNVAVEGPLYRTVLWEVPLLALISELYYDMIGAPSVSPVEAMVQGSHKASWFSKTLRDDSYFVEFGTRRRRSKQFQEYTFEGLRSGSTDGRFRGTSNVRLAMKSGWRAGGTNAHEWYSVAAAIYGYRNANSKAIENWRRVYKGFLATALPDTFTTEVFMRGLSRDDALYLEMFRQDSGDPLRALDFILHYLKKMDIDTNTKRIMFSDSLNTDRIENLQDALQERQHSKVAYGVGTFLTNDKKVTHIDPLNIVMKLMGVRLKKSLPKIPCIKVSDVPGKASGCFNEIHRATAELHICIPD